MDFKNFKFGLVLRSMLLGIAIFFTIFSSYQNKWYLTTIISGVFSFGFMFEIVRYAEKYKKSLSNFLLSIKSRDFISSTNLLPDKATGDILKEAYRVILEEFKNIRIDKEIQYHYLKTVVEHIKTALFSYNNENDIVFINNTAKELLGISANQKIDRIKMISGNLYHLIIKLKSGENELIKLKIEDELYHLSVSATEIKVQNKLIKLISLQNIKQELEHQEVESWQKLIRVLTHEIMNSVTPISSLSAAINDSFDELNHQSELAKLSDNDFEDMLASLKTIENRSKGLLKFVSSYKQLTRIPRPDFKEVNITELINHSATLLKQKIKELNIHFNITTEQDNVQCYVDYDQIEQVIINLILNAIDAVKAVEKPEISIHILKDKINKSKVIISDNGKGIDPDEIDKIFIPFYTTKKEGSGIGLSLSRQIMRLNKGSIQIKSNQGKGTDVILEF